jgi:predicted RNase H-like HicB family nuclease
MMPMHRFLIVIEKAKKNYSAYSPDLPGCVATGKTRDEAEERMHEAIGMHIRGLVQRRTTGPEITFICPLCCRLNVNKV